MMPEQYTNFLDDIFIHISLKFFSLNAPTDAKLPLVQVKTQWRPSSPMHNGGLGAVSGNNVDIMMTLGFQWLEKIYVANK